MRVILFCPTAHSVANPIYETLKNLDDEDIVLNYSDDILLDKLQDIEQLKQYIEDYNEYIKVWKKYMAIDEDMSLLLPDQLLILSNFVKILSIKKNLNINTHPLIFEYWMT